MTASVPISAAHQAEDPAPLLPSNLKSNHMKHKTRSGEPSSPSDSTNHAATHCMFGSSQSAPPQQAAHPLQQLRLRPASWSQESFEDSSDDEWPSLAPPEVPEKGKRSLVSPALSAPVPTTLAKRPVGSITGIFGRDANIWASSLSFTQSVSGYDAHQSLRSPPREPGTDNDIRENGSESDVEEWLDTRRSSSQHSVPLTEDDELHEDPMDVDEPALTPPADLYESPRRSSRRLRSASTSQASPELPLKIPRLSAGASREHSETMEGSDGSASASRTQLDLRDRSQALQRATRIRIAPSSKGPIAPSSEPEQPYIEEPLAPILPEPASTPAALPIAPQRDVRQTSPQAIRPKPSAPSTDEGALIKSSRAEYDMPAVMMFGRRSSPSRAVPLDRFTRGSKGKIPCSWQPPPGHRPCMRSFTRRADLERHISTVHQMLNVACASCGATFSRQDALTRHQRDSCASLFNAQ